MYEGSCSSPGRQEVADPFPDGGLLNFKIEHPRTVAKLLAFERSAVHRVALMNYRYEPAVFLAAQVQGGQSEYRNDVRENHWHDVCLTSG